MKDITANHAWDEVEFYMGMVVEKDQSFENLVEHLHDAFLSGKTLSKIRSDLYGQFKKTRETKDTFIQDLQVLAWKIIAWKLSFHLEANNQLKTKYTHKLQDPYYVVIACSALQSCPGGRNIYNILGMPSDHVWKMHKTQQILCHLHMHWCQIKSNQRLRE